MTGRVAPGVDGAVDGELLAIYLNYYEIELKIFEQREIKITF